MQLIMKRRRYRPLLLVDISVPRNVDSKVATIDNVFLYNIDQLGAMIEENISKRHSQVLFANEIIDEEIVNFDNKDKERDLVPIILTSGSCGIRNCSGALI